MRTQVVVVLILYKLRQLLKAKGRSYRRNQKYGTISPNMIQEIDANVIIVVMTMLVRINIGINLGLTYYSLICFVVMII